MIHMTDREKLTFAKLQSLKIPYEAISHPPMMTMEDCAAADIERFGDTGHCKNIFLCNKQETAFYLLLIEAHKRFRTAEVSKEIGSTRLGFGSHEQLLKLLNLTPGSVTPLGLMFDTSHQVKLLVDKDLFRHERILVHPCVNTGTVCMKTRDLFEVFMPSTCHAVTPVTVSHD